MAKKSFNISSTLKKNSPEIQLAPKIDLKKTVKNPEEILEKVNEIHDISEVLEGKIDTPALAEETPVKEEVFVPTAKKAKAKKKKVEEPIEEKITRLTIDTPSSMHKKLKIRCIEKGVSMRDLILKLIEKEISK